MSVIRHAFGVYAQPRCMLMADGFGARETERSPLYFTCYRHVRLASLEQGAIVFILLFISQGTCSRQGTGVQGRLGLINKANEMK